MWIPIIVYMLGVMITPILYGFLEKKLSWIEWGDDGWIVAFFWPMFLFGYTIVVSFKFVDFSLTKLYNLGRRSP